MQEVLVFLTLAVSLNAPIKAVNNKISLFNALLRVQDANKGH